jgi:hypothetical protein
MCRCTQSRRGVAGSWPAAAGAERDAPGVQHRSREATRLAAHAEVEVQVQYLEVGRFCVATFWTVVRFRPMNAAERFLAASRARNVDAATAELAANVVMLSPATDDPITGAEAVADALRAVEAACDEFQHTHLLADASSDRPSLFGLVFEARVGEAKLRGIDLIEINAHDQITRFEVAARPIAALMALGNRMRESQAT